ncbi:hypothetical protein Q1695_011734 [Nippostrongylus brasiliensis]|nr:hypothetical protein Q1695_011734 [Nippostrongylus brasiliensis]
MGIAITCLNNGLSTESSAFYRYVFGCFMTLITVVSIVLNILVAVIVCGTNGIEGSIRPHVACLIAGCLTYLSSNCFLLLPTIFGNFVIDDTLNVILATPNTIGYLSIMFTTSTMALDRFLIFFLPKTSATLSSSVRWCVFAILPYILAVCVTAHMNLIGCHKRVNPTSMGFSYACCGCGGYLVGLPVLAVSFSTANLVVYSAIFIRIWYMKSLTPTGAYQYSQNSLRKRDVNLVVHFSIICVSQFIGSCSFYILPPLANYSRFSFNLSMVFSSLNTTVNPCVIIIFNAGVRKMIKSFLRPRKCSKPTRAFTSSSKLQTLVTNKLLANVGSILCV